MKTKLTLFLISLLITVFSHAKDVLRLGYLEYPPAIYTDQNNVPRGSTVDFLEQVLLPHFEIKWSKFPIGRVRWAFENQLIDAYPFLYRTKEREEWVHFFKKPYVITQNAICSKKGIAKPAESLASLSDDLAGSTLVYPLNNVGSNYPFLSDARVDQLKINYTKYFERSIDMLDKGRADYVYYPSRGPLQRAGKLSNLSCKNIGKRTGLYFAVSKGNKVALKLENIFDATEMYEP